MLISDWSSDVCSSDLSLTVLKQSPIWVEWEKRRDKAAEFHVSEIWLAANGYNPDKIGGVELSNSRNFIEWSRNGQPWMVLHELSHAYRSEEHASELQSLMRISYAVLCLKKKKKQQIYN